MMYRVTLIFGDTLVTLLVSLEWISKDSEEIL